MLSMPSVRGRKGSRKIRHGLKITSESSPGAWPVELPSKFHLGIDSTDFPLDAGRVRVFERQPPTASTQTYSARILSGGKGRLLYRSMTAGSSKKRIFVHIILLAGVDRPEISRGKHNPSAQTMTQSRL